MKKIISFVALASLFSFTIQPVFALGELPADTTPPVISNVAAVALSHDEVSITWTTNELATSRVTHDEAHHGHITELFLNAGALTSFGLPTNFLFHGSNMAQPQAMAHRRRLMRRFFSHTQHFSPDSLPIQPIITVFMQQIFPTTQQIHAGTASKLRHRLTQLHQQFLMSRIYLWVSMK